MSNLALTNEIVKRLGSSLDVHAMIEDVLDSVNEYQEFALGESMACAVAILYGELSRKGDSFDPNEIISLAYEELSGVAN